MLGRERRRRRMVMTLKGQRRSALVASGFILKQWQIFKKIVPKKCQKLVGPSICIELFWTVENRETADMAVFTRRYWLDIFEVSKHRGACIFGESTHSNYQSQCVSLGISISGILQLDYYNWITTLLRPNWTLLFEWFIMDPSSFLIQDVSIYCS